MQIIKIDRNDRFFKEIFKIYEEWHSHSNLPIEEETYTKAFNEDTLPNIYAFIINDTLIGMYEINAKDNVDDEKYTPYLANLYVKEYYRKNGYSKILIEHCIKTCESLNYDKLYLHSHHKNLYEKYGFKFIKEVDTKYGPKRIFEYKIKPTTK